MGTQGKNKIHLLTLKREKKFREKQNTTAGRLYYVC